MVIVIVFIFVVLFVVVLMLYCYIYVGFGYYLQFKLLPIAIVQYLSYYLCCNYYFVYFRLFKRRCVAVLLITMSFKYNVWF